MIDSKIGNLEGRFTHVYSINVRKNLWATARQFLTFNLFVAEKRGRVFEGGFKGKRFVTHILDIMMFTQYHHDMRTTLTLDEDVAAKLKEETKRSGKSFKETVNTVLRKGLNAPKKKNIEPFHVNPKELKPRVAINYDNIGELLEQIEGPLHR